MTTILSKGRKWEDKKQDEGEERVDMGGKGNTVIRGQAVSPSTCGFSCLQERAEQCRNPGCVESYIMRKGLPRRKDFYNSSTIQTQYIYFIN